MDLMELLHISDHVNGVTTRILESLPMVKYFTHCRSQCMNFDIVNSCNDVPEVHYCMDTFPVLTIVSLIAENISILKSRISQKDTEE